MPKNKFQDVIFTIIMVFVMVYTMICYNIALNVGGMNWVPAFLKSRVAARLISGHIPMMDTTEMAITK